MLKIISLSNLTAMAKIQKNIETKARQVGLINIQTNNKTCRHLLVYSIVHAWQQ